MAHENATFQLPLSIVTPTDLKRLNRELDNISDALLQMEIREGGEAQAKLPKISKPLDDLAVLNKINLLHKEDRESLGKVVKQLLEHSPVMHLSFATEPSTQFIEDLTDRVRKTIGPYILITIGLVPSIGAGCMLRTTNKYFDLSLRQALISKKQELVKALVAAAPKTVAAAREEVAEAEAQTQTQTANMPEGQEVTVQ